MLFYLCIVRTLSETTTTYRPVYATFFTAFYNFDQKWETERMKEKVGIQ